MIKKIFLVLLSSLFLQGCFFQSKKEAIRHHDTRFMMDTLVSIETTGDDEKVLTEATDGAFRLFQEIADETDSYTAHGETDLYAVNAAAGKGPVKASPHLFQIIETILPRHQDELDLTLGPVIAVWNRHKETQSVPSQAEIAEAMKQTGRDRITLSKENRTLTLDPGTRIDLGAVAKGYAVEETARYLQGQKGVRTALINAGGNIKVLGSKANGKPWRIGIQDPVDPQKLLGTLTVEAGTAIATSGDYQRYYEAGGIRYHHILDPATGWPARHAHSVTVVTDSAFRADYYSTLLFVMPPQEAMKTVKNTAGVEMVYEDSKGTLYISDGLRDRFSRNQ